ncbi:hypothetical protein Vadar_032263 [Vaccinium darrowii]|uniref:Uncharacterized protein n=1 Tax=Vaccinium darrowii TaxID=229202 RepID=A0ACB7XDW1_9ERIC|nr:hypothetical protein Vadar_032263 [Vaccinium darrowii]
MEAGSIKKRKICLVDADHHRSDGDDDDDKEKMEKFFSLIRSIREARDHLSKGSAEAVLVQMVVQDQEEGIIIKNKKQQQQKSCSVNDQEESKKQKKAGWNINIPSFQREDFVDDFNLRISPPALAAYLAPPASSDQINIQANVCQDDIIKHGLDLNLSL